MKNTIFVVISKDIIRRNILDTDFWDTFLESIDDKMTIVLIVDQSQEDWYKEKYESSRVVVEGYQKKSLTGLQKILNFLIRTGINSHSTRTYRNRALRRKESSVFSYVIKGCIANTVGNSTFYKRAIRALLLKTKPPRAVSNLFDIYKPTAVFVPSLADNEFDVQFALVAKQRHVRTIGMVRSWDNFNNHGILSVTPDVFIFQNQWLVEAIKKFQGINPQDIPHYVIGLPHYDDYKDFIQYVKPREVFMEAFGMDPSKRFVLFGGSDFYYSEDSIPKILDEAIENGLIKVPLQVVFRPHPATLFTKEDYGLDKLRHIFLDDAFSRGKKFSDTEKFVNLMYHADIIINIASTLSIDAAVFNKPAICINFDDSSKKLSYYEQVHRLYDHFDHYEHLMSTRGVRVPSSKEEFIRDINRYLKDASLDQEGRVKIVETFVEPFDGHAGQRLGKIVAQQMGVK